MTTAVDLDELTRQTRRQEFVDGLNDLQTGLVFLLLGGTGAFLFSNAGMSFYARALLWNRELTILGLIGLLGLLVLFGIGMRRGVECLRGQVLWKGCGQAVPLRVQIHWPLTAAVTGVCLILIIAGLMYVPVVESNLGSAMRVLAVTSGLGTGILYVALGRELGLRRLQWAGLAGGLLSTAIYFLPLSAARSWLALGGVWALTLLVSGGLALRSRLAEVRSQDG